MTHVRVLHVENDALVARAVARVLGRHGFATATADSCNTARAVLGEFDIGVFDVDLGDGNGVGLAEELLSRGTVTSAIFFTGTGDSGLLRRAASNGNVVRKPEGVDALLSELETLRCAGGPRRAESRRAPPTSGYPSADTAEDTAHVTRRAG